MRKLFLFCTILLLTVACKQQPASGNDSSEPASETASEAAAPAAVSETSSAASEAAEVATDQTDYPTYIDLELSDPEGNTVRLSDYVGKSKYLLVDFWASWCAPCRAEMPTVVRAYNDFHAKGFNVVGISLDTRLDMWKMAISQMQMPWPHMSDLGGWDSKAAAVYRINSIPANLLLNEQGQVIDGNLRGERLLNKLAELLK